MTQKIERKSIVKIIADYIKNSIVSYNKLESMLKFMATLNDNRKCPKCRGRGSYIDNHSSYNYSYCEACNGKGTIQ